MVIKLKIKSLKSVDSSSLLCCLLTCLADEGYRGTESSTHNPDVAQWSNTESCEQLCHSDSPVYSLLEINPNP